MTGLDVLCVGSATYDLLYTVEEHPGPDEKCVASALVQSGGGPAANAAVTVARLGGQSAFAGYLGLDPFGQAHVAELEDAGVVTRFIHRGHHATSLSTILVKPSGDRAVINFTERDPVAATAIDLSPSMAKAILFDGHEPELSVPLARAAREQGIPTILDAGSVREGTSTLVSMVDILITSERFALDFTGRGDAERALSDLAIIAPEVVITLGGEGLIWQGSHGCGSIPAFAVDVVDTSGAGDAFHGAFALGLARGLYWDTNLRSACAVAALCCTRHGARRGIPRREELLTFFDDLGEQFPL